LKLRLIPFTLFAGSIALFLVASSHETPARSLPAPQSQTITCSSDDMHRHACTADTRGGVQLVRQRSGSPCDFGRTWGYDDSGIWVDRGCRADFQTGVANWSGYGQSYTVYCASDDMGRNFCPVDTSYGVSLARRRSDADCTYGRTWGYNRRGIWVDRGCRADFQLGSADWNGSTPAQTTTCSSDDMRMHYCNADTSNGVRLIRQRSDADCLYGSTWGYDDRGIWVDRGCRADFEIGGGDDDGDWDDQPYTVRVYCASDDMHRHVCYTGRNGGVRLVKQRSGSECVEGRTWGADRRGIWVDRGCRADFEVAVGGRMRRGGGGGNPNQPASTIYCASDDMHRHYCSADTRGGVQLVKQHSGSACVQGRSWGYDSQGIWVDRGCRADFEIAVGDRMRR